MVLIVEDNEVPVVHKDSVESAGPSTAARNDVSDDENMPLSEWYAREQAKDRLKGVSHASEHGDVGGSTGSSPPTDADAAPGEETSSKVHNKDAPCTPNDNHSTLPAERLQVLQGDTQARDACAGVLSVVLTYITSCSRTPLYVRHCHVMRACREC